MKITNKADISLPIAVWLLDDNYDYNSDERYISATSIMRPIRQIVLGARVPSDEREMDVQDNLASSLGTAVHDSVEAAWRRSGIKALKQLGYPDKVAESLVINPTPEDFSKNPNLLACYIEQRTTKVVDDYTIGGKFDMILDGRLYDHKTTSVYTYLLGSKDEDYALQGGIYRWLNPDKVIDPHIHINFIFTDWQRAQVSQNPNYPKLRTQEYPVLLLDPAEVEKYIRQKLRDLDRFWKAEQKDLPRCTDKELWRSDPVYKYFSDPAKINVVGARSSKNFTDKAEADAHLAAQGKGAIKTIPGEVKACQYCPAFSICEQRKEYFPDV